MRSSLACFCITLAVLFMGGCYATPPSQHYFLTPLAEHAQPEANPKSDMTIAVVPVRVPQYLDRPQIVTRIGPNELYLDEFNRWTGPIQDNITDVIVQNLAALLPDARVARHPVPASLAVEYQVFVDFIQFDGKRGQSVTLLANWGIAPKGDQAPRALILQNFEKTEPVVSEDYSTLVAAQSRALVDLSHEIAQALAALYNGRAIEDGNHGKADPQ